MTGHKLYKILAVIIAMVLLLGCSKTKETKFINEQTGKKETIKIIRFDRELFAFKDGDLKTYLKDLQTKYPEMFASSLDDEKYLQMIERFVTDNYLLDAQNIVQKTYPDISFLEKDLTSAFAKLKTQHKDTELPRRFFTMIFGPAEFEYCLQNKNYTNGDYVTIALDIYSYPAIEKNPYYNQMPQYIIPTLNQRYIAPDFMRMYLKNVTYRNTQDVQMNPDCTLLDCIIDEGKYSYIISQILPTYKDYEVLRYTQQQMDWCNENEKLIWGYIIQNQLLYEKDRSKYMSLTAEGPTSKPLGDSPSRVGHFIGYNIVKNFMDKENISWDSLMNITDSQLILKKSNYKPKK